MRKAKLTGYLILFICIAALTINSALKKTRTVQRDIPTLLNFYYNYKDKEPLRAKEALDLILRQEPTNHQAIHASVSWFMHKGDTHSALTFLKQSHNAHPDDPYINFELAQLYVLLNQMSDAKPLLQQVQQSPNPSVQKKAAVLYESLFPQETLSQAPSHYRSYIEPIRVGIKADFAPLYAKVAEISALQPDSARHYLQLILSIDPNAEQAYVMLGYLELQQHNPQLAQQYFLKAFALKHRAQLAVQIGYLYASNHQLTQALYYFNYGVAHGDEGLKQQSLEAIKVLASNPVAHFAATALRSGLGGLSGLSGLSQPQSPADRLWTIFYENKLSQPQLARKAINKLLALHPDDLRTLKEAAYFATAQKDSPAAIALWLRAYSLQQDAEYALSIAYLYDGMDNRIKAYQYFSLAAKTTDSVLKLKAEIAKTAMGGAQFKIFPKPYFIEFYGAPFYFSRFDLAVLPTISRAGVTLDEKHHTDVYLSWRRTKDDRSGGPKGFIIENSISQIFEDNVAIYAAGLRSYPWPKIPLQTFIEVGQAEDLVYRDRNKWRSDVRGGLVYFNAWGEQPTWTGNLSLPLKWRTTLYADTIYYSRYDNNVIGTAWFRPGLRLATLRAASLDAYVANYLILDKNHEFYNNIYSVGPGIAFQPNNRINLVLRLESLQGYYIKVNSPSPNPYRSRYYNNIAMVETYFRF